MKKIKYLLLLVMSCTFLMGTANAAVTSETLKEACAEEELTCNYTEKDTSDLPNIYVFRGNGCGYCQRLLSHLASIYDEISDKVNIVVYEVGESSHSDNWDFYEKVAAKFGDTVQGYPYMVIGETVFDGYASDYDADIMTAIEKLATTEEPYDVAEEVNAGNTDLVEKDTLEDESKESSNGPVIAFIFGVIVVIGVFTGYQVTKK